MSVLALHQFLHSFEYKGSVLLPAQHDKQLELRLHHSDGVCGQFTKAVQPLAASG